VLTLYFVVAPAPVDEPPLASDPGGADAALPDCTPGLAGFFVVGCVGATAGWAALFVIGAEPARSGCFMPPGSVDGVVGVGGVVGVVVVCAKTADEPAMANVATTNATGRVFMTSPSGIGRLKTGKRRAAAPPLSTNRWFIERRGKASRLRNASSRTAT
jgi:hypothetical protein